MKKTVSWLLSLAMIFSLSACGTPSNTDTDTTPQPDTTNAANADASTDEITIGVSLGQNVHPYFVAMQLGIEKACADLGISKINILSADGSLETQVSQIENLVTMGCDAILINPYDSEGVANAVSAAKKAGVGIITMDIDCAGSDAFIASDNYVIGEMLADYVIKELNGQGKIAILDGISVTSLKDRTEGFLSKIAASDIEVVAEQYVAMQRETSLEAAETILQANAQLDAFVGINENSGMAILSAVTAAGRNDQILITTVDATSENLSAIRDGKVAVGISQNPYMMGYQAVEQAVKYHKGEEVTSFVEVEVDYMTTENVAQYIEREQGYGVEVE